MRALAGSPPLHNQKRSTIHFLTGVVWRVCPLNLVVGVLWGFQITNTRLWPLNILLLLVEAGLLCSIPILIEVAQENGPPHPPLSQIYPGKKPQTV